MGRVVECAKMHKKKPSNFKTDGLSLHILHASSGLK